MLVSQEGEIACAAFWLLIEIRFQTPKNVPGNSMKTSPAPIYAISNRESALSRLLVTSKISCGDMACPARASIRVTNPPDILP